MPAKSGQLIRHGEADHWERAVAEAANAMRDLLACGGREFDGITLYPRSETGDATGWTAEAVWDEPADQ